MPKKVMDTVVELHVTWIHMDIQGAYSNVSWNDIKIKQSVENERYFSAILVADRCCFWCSSKLLFVLHLSLSLSIILHAHLCELPVYMYFYEYFVVAHVMAVHGIQFNLSSSVFFFVCLFVSFFLTVIKKTYPLWSDHPCVRRPVCSYYSCSFLFLPNIYCLAQANTHTHTHVKQMEQAQR